METERDLQAELLTSLAGEVEFITYPAGDISLPEGTFLVYHHPWFKRLVFAHTRRGATYAYDGKKSHWFLVGIPSQEEMRDLEGWANKRWSASRGLPHFFRDFQFIPSPQTLAYWRHRGEARSTLGNRVGSGEHDSHGAPAWTLILE